MRLRDVLRKESTMTVDDYIVHSSQRRERARALGSDACATAVERAFDVYELQHGLRKAEEATEGVSVEDTHTDSNTEAVS